MSNIIKISREFKDSILGGIWLGREIEIDDAADPIQAFVKANEELNEAYRRLSGGNGYDGGKVNWRPIDEIGQWSPITATPPNQIPTIQVSKTDSKDKAIQSIKEEILGCTDVVTLGTYRKIALTDDTLKEAYFATAERLNFSTQ